MFFEITPNNSVKRIGSCVRTDNFEMPKERFVVIVIGLPLNIRRWIYNSYNLI